MFTQFLDQTSMGTLASVMLIATVFALNNFIVFSIWTVIGDTIASLFRSPESSKKLKLVFGMVLIAVAIWMLLS